MFSADFFTRNRERLVKSANTDIVVLSANGLLQKSADTTFSFRQDSNFWYLTGLEIADAVVVILVKTNASYVILPKRLKHRDQWEGAIDISACAATSGIQEIYTHDQGWERLKQDVASAKNVGCILPAQGYEPHYGMYINPAKLVFSRKLKRVCGNKVTDCRMKLSALRQIKSPEEVSAITKAVAITAHSLQTIHQHLQQYKNEKDIQIRLSYEFALGGAESHAYDPIIACGKNAATIHYEKNNAPLKNGNLLLLDVGALYQKYAADVSRTWAIGQPTARQIAVHAAVHRVHAYALTLLRPGVVLREYENKVRGLMKKELVGLGLLPTVDSPEERTYYPHLTSHFLGLDVHDAGVYDQPLQPNMVITVEPGIYIANEEIGIRIEDDVLITEDGCRNLSAEVPVSLVY